MKTLHETITETVNALKNGSRRLNEKNLIRLAEDTIQQNGILSQFPKRTELAVKVYYVDGSTEVYDFGAKTLEASNSSTAEANRLILDFEQCGINEITILK